MARGTARLRLTHLEWHSQNTEARPYWSNTFIYLYKIIFKCIIYIRIYYILIIYYAFICNEIFILNYIIWIYYLVLSIQNIHNGLLDAMKLSVCTDDCSELSWVLNLSLSCGSASHLPAGTRSRAQQQSSALPFEEPFTSPLQEHLTNSAPLQPTEKGKLFFTGT